MSGRAGFPRIKVPLYCTMMGTWFHQGSKHQDNRQPEIYEGNTSRSGSVFGFGFGAGFEFRFGCGIGSAFRFGFEFGFGVEVGIEREQTILVWDLGDSRVECCWQDQVHAKGWHVTSMR